MTGHGALILVISRNIQVSYFYIFHVVLSVLFKLSTCQICMRSARVSQIFWIHIVGQTLMKVNYVFRGFCLVPFCISWAVYWWNFGSMDIPIQMFVTV